MEKVTEDMERCIVRCADEHVDLLPSMFKRMAENLQKLEGN